MSALLIHAISMLLARTPMVVMNAGAKRDFQAMAQCAQTRMNVITILVIRTLSALIQLDPMNALVRQDGKEKALAEMVAKVSKLFFKMFAEFMIVALPSDLEIWMRMSSQLIPHLIGVTSLVTIYSRLLNWTT